MIPPLQMQERGANTDLTQTHHSREESLLRSAPLISRTGKPGSVSNEESRVKDWRMKFSCLLFKSNESKFWQKRNLRSKKFDERASFDENYIRDLKSQIDTRDGDLRLTLEGYMEASQTKDRLRHEVADTARAPQEDSLRGFQEIESMKRNHEFYVDEFSRTKITG